MLVCGLELHLNIKSIKNKKGLVLVLWFGIIPKCKKGGGGGIKKKMLVLWVGIILKYKKDYKQKSLVLVLWFGITLKYQED